MKHTLAGIVLLLLFNTAIAALLTVIEFGHGFWINLLFSQCIGIAIGVVNVPLAFVVAPGWRRWTGLVFTLPLSVFLGSNLAAHLAGMPLQMDKLGQSMAVGLMFGVVGSAIFLLAERIRDLDREVRQHRLEEAERARREAEAHLHLLQAQIEPHFLFNTLANLASLIEADPVRARQLLDRLIDWLRVALARSRQDQATLEGELQLLENWLEILAIRFGPRLAWRIEATPEARRAAIPPMLLQPLLENAVKHGIEPKLGGGRLWLEARVEQGQLHIEIGDDGVGLDPAKSAAGTGLDNVRARLAALYGDAGRLSISGHAGGGVRVQLELPCAP